MAKLFTKRVKVWLFTILGFIVGCAISFGTGSFYPNFYVKDKIIQELQADSVRIFREFGYHEPAIEYSNNKEFVLKAQIHAGGRGKAGGVKLIKNFADLEKEATQMMGKTLVTHQTGPEGKKIKLFPETNYQN